MHNSTLVEGKNVNVFRGHGRAQVHILKDLSFALPRGKVIGLLGASGCGKTTLMRTLAGVQQYTGELTVLGFPPGHRKILGNIGYVTQSATTYEDLTVWENLSYFSALHGIMPDKSILDNLALTDHEHSLVAQLSGGQRNRASLACALAAHPELLIMDEPTVGLDPLTRTKLWEYFSYLVAEKQATLLVSSHVLDEAEKCNELLIMHNGRIIWTGTPSELLDTTGTQRYTDALLSILENQQ